MAKATEGTPQFDITVVEEKIHGMQAMVDATIVNSNETLAAVADKIKGVKTLGKFIEQEKEKYTKPAMEIVSAARAKYVPLERECENAERALKSKAQAYLTAVEDERRRKEAIIAKQMAAGRLGETKAIEKMEKLGEEKKSVVSESGSKLTMKTVRKVEIVDASLIPHEYFTLDEGKVRKVALAGIVIPGVRVIESKEMSA